ARTLLDPRTNRMLSHDNPRIQSVVSSGTRVVFASPPHRTGGASSTRRGEGMEVGVTHEVNTLRNSVHASNVWQPARPFAPGPTPAPCVWPPLPLTLSPLKSGERGQVAVGLLRGGNR